MQNPYVPYPVELIKVVTEVDTKDIKTFRFAFINKEDEEKFKYIPVSSENCRSSARGNPLSGSPRRPPIPDMWSSLCKRQAS